MHSLGIIFDMDGLLVDSEALHFQAYHDVFKPFGIDLTVEMFVSGWLEGNRYGTRQYLEKIGRGDDETFQRVRDQKSERFIELARGKLQLMPGVKFFLERLKSENIVCGVGTGAYPQEYEFIANECNLKDYLEVFVGGCDVEHNKPAPDIFLEVAKRLNIEPERTIVFENSSLGMHSAFRAGMKCVIVPSPFTRNQDFTGASQMLSRIDAISIETLESMLE